jgi:hypothetical protein
VTSKIAKWRRAPISKLAQVKLRHTHHRIFIEPAPHKRGAHENKTPNENCAGVGNRGGKEPIIVVVRAAGKHATELNSPKPGLPSPLIAEAVSDSLLL